MEQVSTAAKVPGYSDAGRVDLGASLAGRIDPGAAFDQRLTPKTSMDRVNHAMVIEGSLRAISALVTAGKGGIGNDTVEAGATDLACLISLIADAVEPLCKDDEA